MKNIKNTRVIEAVVAIILIGAAFYGGMTYQKHAIASARGQFFTSGAQGGQFAGRTGGFGGAGGARGGNFIAGSILSQDASGITIKMPDGSTKIILIGTSAQINKNAAGTMADLAVGTNVSVTGTTNSDGSVTAQAIQIRPAGQGFGSTTPRQ